MPAWVENLRFPDPTGICSTPFGATLGTTIIHRRSRNAPMHVGTQAIQAIAKCTYAQPSSANLREQVLPSRSVALHTKQSLFMWYTKHTRVDPPFGPLILHKLGGTSWEGPWDQK